MCDGEGEGEIERWRETISSEILLNKSHTRKARSTASLSNRQRCSTSCSFGRRENKMKMMKNEKTSAKKTKKLIRQFKVFPPLPLISISFRYK